MNIMKTILKIITILFVFVSVNAVFALPDIKTQLNSIEYSLWGFEYKDEENAKRIERIEQELFGSIDKTANLQERIDKINNTLGLEGTEEENLAIKKQVDDIQAKGVSYPKIDAIEKKLFGKTWDNEGIYTRLERIEQKVFSKKQKGDLNERVDRICATVNIDIAQNNQYQESYQSNYQDNNQQQENYPQYNKNDLYLQIAGLENTAFRKTYDQDPMSVRLNRLERKIFQRDFSTDDEVTRIQRIQAASTATKTSKYYDGNRFQKFASTGMQLGTLILMILAMIL